MKTYFDYILFIINIYRNPRIGENESYGRPISILQMQRLDITITITFVSCNNRFMITNEIFL